MVVYCRDVLLVKRTFSLLGTSATVNVHVCVQTCMSISGAEVPRLGHGGYTSKALILQCATKKAIAAYTTIIKSPVSPLL